jgi:hypothetical protein
MSPETFSKLSFVIQTAVNAMVAICLLPMWHRRRHAFLLVLGISAVLGLLTGVASQILEHVPMSEPEFLALWQVNSVLGMTDMVLYAVGILGMVRQFRTQPVAASTDAPIG